MTNTVALVQARMSSSRFQGKVLEPLNGVPMIVFMIERARRARLLNDVVVVTSTDPSDDPLVSTLEKHRIPLFRGDLADVLARYKHAADHFKATEVVRLTGDCPLVDPEIVDEVLRARAGANADYASNIDPPTFPDGFDVECFSKHALDRAFNEASSAAEREHVTLWMRSDKANLRRCNVRAPADLSHLRLTVDYPNDLEAVRSVVAACGRPDCDLFDVLRALHRNPQIVQMNQHPRNEGLAKSLAAEAGGGTK